MKTYKIVIIGDSAVGKTSVLNHYIFGGFNKSISTTIGASFMSCIRYAGNDKQIRLNCWDTAGQERYRSMVSLYYRNADYCVIVFDITNYNKQNIEYWINEYFLSTHSPKYVLVANKCDLPHEGCQDIVDLGVKVFYTSATNGEGIKDLFQHIIDQLITNDPNSTDIIPFSSVNQNNNKCFC